MSDDKKEGERTRRALKNAEKGKGKPAKDVLRDIREILNFAKK